MTDNERAEVAREVVQEIMAGMVKNSAYEYDGKPIYDGLTYHHVVAVMKRFNVKVAS